jgi:[ribosomal protein S18]-alanine N-acetyltransferase
MRKYFPPSNWYVRIAKPLLIRPATIADLPAIVAVATTAATAAQWPQEHYEHAIQNLQPRRLVLVLEEQNVILAFLVALAVANEWELENIVSASRRKGIGSSILNKFLDMARQERAEAIFLEVRESNTAARSFYEKLAFEVTGRRPHYYTDPEEAAIVYRHPLS